MNVSDFLYPEEIIPILKENVRLFTHGESTSVSEETARQLTASILYCIDECGQADYELCIRGERPDVSALYEQGLCEVKKKVAKTRHIYNRLMKELEFYQNRAYYDTLVKGMPEFFKHYDVRFAAHETILTLDYPIISKINERGGIDTIYDYLADVCMEQRFLNGVSIGYIKACLSRYHYSSQDMLENITYLVLFQILISGLFKENTIYIESHSAKWELLSSKVKEFSKDSLEEQLRIILHEMIQKKYHEDVLLEEYLGQTCQDYAVRLQNAAENGNLQMLLCGMGDILGE